MSTPAVLGRTSEFRFMVVDLLRCPFALVLRIKREHEEAIIVMNATQSWSGLWSILRRASDIVERRQILDVTWSESAPLKTILRQGHWIDWREIRIHHPGDLAINARGYLQIGEQDRVMMKAVLDTLDRNRSILSSISASWLIEEGEEVERIRYIPASPVWVNDLIEDIRDGSLQACGSSFGSFGFRVERRDMVSGEWLALSKIGNHVAEIALVQISSSL
jgi:hypothetical protein